MTGLGNKELTERRQESLQRYYAFEEEQRKLTAEKTYEMDKTSVRQQMNIESNMRNYIEGTKEKMLQDEN